MVELGRIYIAVEVSKLSSFLIMPRQGYLYAACHIMSYLKHKYNSCLVMNPYPPNITYSHFLKNQYWTSKYGDVTEALPLNAPEELRDSVELHLYVDSDHVGDTEDHHSGTGYMVYMDFSLIDWLTKKQATVEGAMFGAEFVALKHDVKSCRGIHYKLHMMGVPING